MCIYISIYTRKRNQDDSFLCLIYFYHLYKCNTLSYSCGNKKENSSTRNVYNENEDNSQAQFMTNIQRYAFRRLLFEDILEHNCMFL